MSNENELCVCGHPRSEHKKAYCYCDRTTAGENGCLAHADPPNYECSHRFCTCPNFGGRRNPFSKEYAEFLRRA